MTIWARDRFGSAMLALTLALVTWPVMAQAQQKVLRVVPQGEVKVFDRTSVEEVPARADGAAIVVTNKTPLPGHVLRELPQLRYIGSHPANVRWALDPQEIAVLHHQWRHGGRNFADECTHLELLR